MEIIDEMRNRTIWIGTDKKPRNGVAKLYTLTVQWENGMQTFIS